MLDDFLKYNTCDASDGLDALGIQGQMEGIRPLWPGSKPIVGRALTMKLHPQAKHSTVVGTLEGIETAQPGDIIVLDNDGRLEVNTFGSIAAYCAQKRGVVGCVTDGCTRDIDGMEEIDFPIYGKGVITTSVRDRVGFVASQVPVRCGGIDIVPGDVIMADANGAVAIPADRVEKVLELARFFREMEARVKEGVDSGESPVAVHQRLQYDQSFPDMHEQQGVPLDAADQSDSA